MNRCDLEELVNVLSQKLAAIPLEKFQFSRRLLLHYLGETIVARADGFCLTKEIHRTYSDDDYTRQPHITESYSVSFEEQSIQELIKQTENLWPSLEKLYEQRRKEEANRRIREADDKRCEAIYEKLYPNQVAPHKSLVERIKSWWRGM